MALVVLDLLRHRQAGQRRLERGLGLSDTQVPAGVVQQVGLRHDEVHAVGILHQERQIQDLALAQSLLQFANRLLRVDGLPAGLVPVAGDARV